MKENEVKRGMCYVEIVPAVTIQCEFEGKVAEYAMMWLNLTNNAREYRKQFLKVENNYENTVWVTTTPETVKDMKDYLEGIGLTIKDEYEARAFVTTVDYHYEDTLGIGKVDNVWSRIGFEYEM